MLRRHGVRPSTLGYDFGLSGELCSVSDAIQRSHWFFLAYADFHACHVQAALALVARVCGSYEGDAALVPIGSDR